jgi:hypothetical protein
MCTVEAPDETAAGAVAVSLFDLEQRKRPVLGESRRDRSALHCAATVMAVTKCPIPAHTVSAFTVPPTATRQCGRTGRLDSPFCWLNGEDHEQEHDAKFQSQPSKSASLRKS